MTLGRLRAPGAAAMIETSDRSDAIERELGDLAILEGAREPPVW